MEYARDGDHFPEQEMGKHAQSFKPPGSSLKGMRGVNFSILTSQRRRTTRTLDKCTDRQAGRLTGMESRFVTECDFLQLRNLVKQFLLYVRTADFGAWTP